MVPRAPERERRLVVRRRSSCTIRYGVVVQPSATSQLFEQSLAPPQPRAQPAVQLVISQLSVASLVQVRPQPSPEQSTLHDVESVHVVARPPPE